MTITRMYSNPTNVVAQDVNALTAATKTIDFAAYTLTHPEVVTALLTAAQKGVTIRLYLDRSELEAEARGNPALPTMALRNLLNSGNITIKVKQSTVLMHLKSYLVDGVTLRDGSANFSPIGEDEQDNSIELTDDSQSVALFEAKFAQMWNRPDNLTVAAAIETSPAYASHRLSAR